MLSLQLRKRCLKASVATVLIAGCGSRTGLLGGLEEPSDAGLDAAHRFDGGVDRNVPDVGPDTIPAIDATHRDVVNTMCPDAAATLVYVITSQNDLYSFYPPDATFTPIGPIACPVAMMGATPFSMAVDRKGIAYSVFSDGELFRISTATAACRATGYVANQQGWLDFGMGFAADMSMAGESLFVAEGNFTTFSKGLGSIDTTSYMLNVIGPFTPPIPRAELTGTGDGRLFAFYPNLPMQGNGSHIAQIDQTTAQVIGQDDLMVGTPSDAFAFAFWGGSFWIFTTAPPAMASTVTRFDPATKSETTVTTMPQTIVGAGVSTCAPSQ